MRILRWLFGVVIFCSVVVSMGFMGVKTVKAEASSEIIEGNVRIQVLSDTIIRIERRSANGYENRNTFHIPNRDRFEGGIASVEKGDTATVITTRFVRVVVPNNADTVSDVKILSLNNNYPLWTGKAEVTSKVELPSPSETGAVFAIVDSPRIIVPEHNYSNKDNVRTSATDPLNGYEIEENAKDIYVMIPLGDAKKLRSDYCLLTGESELVPLSALGAWDSRFYPYTEETAKEQITNYQDYDLPLDNMVIDTDWRKGAGGTGYDINTDYFPDMGRFFDFAHDNNINIMFNDHPEPVRQGNTLLNILQPEEVANREYQLQRLLDMGLDYWWYDRNWGVSLVSPSSEISKETLGMYLFYQITQNYLDSIAADGEYAKRALIMANADNIEDGFYSGTGLSGNGRPGKAGVGNMASHRYSIQWTGDIQGNSASLKREVHNSIYGGYAASIPYLSSDIGGFLGTPSDEMYVRWIQYGTFSPIYRTHSINDVKFRMPWLYSEEALNITREYVKMRYRLLPTYYSLAFENYLTGMPMIRSLEFDYPQYEQSKSTDQYLIGENILVAPIFEPDVTSVPNAWFTDLKADYYTSGEGNDFSGTPAYSTDINNIYFDWGNGESDGKTGSPFPAGHANNGHKNNFSAKFVGKFTAGEDAALTLTADDGVRVWIDGKQIINEWKPSDSLTFDLGNFYAGVTHNIEVRYYEGYGDARIKINYQPIDKPVSRSVFIPDGKWINVFDGNSYVGPNNYTIVSKINSSPIFIKEGSITALAEDMNNTAEKDWSNLTLDIYPSKTNIAKGSLYEDDTVTVAYKDGLYRKTDFTAKYDDSKKVLTIDISAAKGSFEGEKAFDERTWNVRLHSLDSFGKIDRVKMGNTTLTVQKHNASNSARPFENHGASIEGTVYELSVTAKVADSSTIKIYFEGAPSTSNQNEDETNGCGVLTFPSQLLLMLIPMTMLLSLALVIKRKVATVQG